MTTVKVAEDLERPNTQTICDSNNPSNTMYLPDELWSMIVSHLNTEELMQSVTQREHVLMSARRALAIEHQTHTDLFVHLTHCFNDYHHRLVHIALHSDAPAPNVLAIRKLTHDMMEIKSLLLQYINEAQF